MKFNLISAALLYAAVINLSHGADFTLSSQDVPADSTLKLEQVYQGGYGCEGGNISPDLTWQNPPAGTKSFAIEVHDPDAPTGDGWGWWHWLAYDIPADARSIAHAAGSAGGEKLLPKGTIQGGSSFGEPSFGGACPPVGHGVHRYHFRIYALKVDKLNVRKLISPVRLSEAIRDQSLGVAKFTATYSRE